MAKQQIPVDAAKPDPDFAIDAEMVDSTDFAARLSATEAIQDVEPLDTHRSIKSRLLSALAIFLVGAVAALWAGPKIAPNLPTGLAPVSRWLLPGQDAALLAVEAVKVELTTRIDALTAGVDETQVTALIAGQTAPLAGRISAVEALATADESALLAGRVAALNVKVAGLAAELAALQATPLTAGGTSAATPVELTRLTARIDGMQATIGELASQQSALRLQFDKVATNAGQNIAAAQNEADDMRQSAETQAALATIASAIATGAPYADALAQLPATELPEALVANANAGVASLLALREEFPSAAHEAIRAAIVAEAGDGVTARIGAFLQSQVAARSLTPQTGTSADAVLSRVEEALRNDDLARAIVEVQALPDAAKSALSGWGAKVEARRAVEAALAELVAAK